MPNQELERRIARATDHAAPDLSERILSSCKEQKGRVISMDEKQKKPKTTKSKRYLAGLSSLAAILVLCIGLWGYSNLQSSQKSNSIIMLDVNPSISLTVNKKEEVIDSQGLNEDGSKILDDMDLKGTDLNVAVNAIIGSMLQKGYLSDLQNAILVSVENPNAQESQRLQARVSDAINGILQGTDLEGTVLSQTLKESSALEQTANELGISLGKAALIQEVISQDPSLDPTELSALSIHEIALISNSRDLSSDAIIQTGTASDKAYIGTDAAAAAAYQYAGVTAQEVSRLDMDFDSDNGTMIYEVEFFVGDTEYDCEVNASTGEVIKCETKGSASSSGTDSNVPPTSVTPSDTGNPAAETPAEKTSAFEAQDTNTPSSGTQPTETPTDNSQASSDSPSYIGEDAAKTIALTDAGISESDIIYINVSMEYDDGRPEHYEVEFTTGNYEYEYEIDLYSGAILERSIDNHYNDDYDDYYNGHHSNHHSEQHHY